MENQKTVLAVSFTTKNQDLSKIAPLVNEVLQDFRSLEGIPSDQLEIVHAFMPKELVKEKGLEPNINIFLDMLPGDKTCFYDLKNGTPQREEMAKYLDRNCGTALIFGEVIDGVLQEVNNYMQMQNVKIIRFPI